MKTIRYTPDALASLKKFRSVAKRIVAKISHYAQTGSGDVKTLVGRPGKRLRVGDFRVIFEETATDITVLDIGPRGDIYE